MFQSSDQLTQTFNTGYKLFDLPAPLRVDYSVEHFHSSELRQQITKPASHQWRVVSCQALFSRQNQEALEAQRRWLQSLLSSWDDEDTDYKANLRHLMQCSQDPNIAQLMANRSQQHLGIALMVIGLKWRLELTVSDKEEQLVTASLGAVDYTGLALLALWPKLANPGPMRDHWFHYRAQANAQMANRRMSDIEGAAFKALGITSTPLFCDKDNTVREAATNVLRKSETEQTVHELIKIITHGTNFQTKTYMCEHLVAPNHSQQAIDIDILCQYVRQDSDIVYKGAACHLLGQIGNQQAIDTLCERARQDSDKHVRAHACKILSRVGGQQAIDTLCDRARKDSSFIVNIEACRSLGQIADQQSVDTLTNIIRRFNYGKDFMDLLFMVVEFDPINFRRIRETACLALAQIGNQQAIDALCESAQRVSNSQVRKKACEVLKRFKGQRVIKTLCERARQDNFSFVRQVACHSMGQIGSLEAVDTLIDRVKHDNNSDVRQTACRALDQIGAKEAVNILIDRAKHDNNSNVRQAACHALGQLSAREAVDTLIERASHDNNRFARKAACEALGRIGARDAVNTLTERARLDNDDVRLSACQALKQIGSQEAVNTLIERAKHDNNRFIIEMVYHALVEIGGQDAVNTLIQRAKHGTTRLARKTACDALGQIGTREAVNTLIERVTQDNDVNIRMGACVVLGRIGAREAVNTLIERVKQDNNPFVRHIATEALGQIGAHESVNTLIERARHGDDGDNVTARITACEALGQIGSEDAINTLIERIRQDTNPFVREKAYAALMQCLNQTLQHFNQNRDEQSQQDLITVKHKLVTIDERLNTMISNFSHREAHLLESHSSIHSAHSDEQDQHWSIATSPVSYFYNNNGGSNQPSELHQCNFDMG